MMDGAGGPLRKDLQPSLCPCGRMQSLQGDLLPSKASSIDLARPGDPRFGKQGTVEAMSLLPPPHIIWVLPLPLGKCYQKFTPFSLQSFVSVISLSKRRCFFVVVGFFFFLKKSS